MNQGPLETIHEKAHPAKGISAWMPLIGLYCLILFHVLINIWWLRVDNHPVRADEEVHMLMARQYFEAMYYDPGASMLDRVLEVARIPLQNPAHPPLLHVTGATFIAVFGYSVDIIAGANTLSFVLVLLGVFLILRKFLSPRESLFGTTVVSLTPLIFMASRFFMTDYLSLAIVVWAIYALIQSDQYRNTGWVFIFAILNGLGILCRATTFLYYFTPCMIVVALGLWLALKSSAGPVRRTALGRWLLHCVMTLVVTVGIFSPWYFHHADAFIQSWTVDHQSQGPLAGLVPDWDAADPWVNWPRLAEVAHAAPAEGTQAAPTDSRLGKIVNRLVHPQISWHDYLVHTINNGTFLVLFILGLAGIPIALWSRRFYSMPVIIILAWLLGSYVLMTLLFKGSTARYTLQALPALSIFATLTILAIPRQDIRKICGALLLALLSFQFFNLSVHAAGPLKRIDLPIVLNQHIHDTYNDPGLVLYKHDLGIGEAYAHMEAPTARNFRDWTFLTLMEGEAKLGPLARGEYANYLRLGVRGMAFLEKHYWPAPNAYKHPAIPVESLPKRKFRDDGYVLEVEHLEPKLDNADYVVMAVKSEEADKEARWRTYLQAHNYTQIGDTFTTLRGGLMPAKNYTVYQRNVEQDAVRIESVEDIAELNLDDLYTLKNHADYPRLDHLLREAAETHFLELVQTGNPAFPMSDAVDLISVNRSKVGEDLFEFQLIFKTKKKMTKDFRIYFHGRIADTTQLPQKYQAQGYQDWNFNPAPPTSTWPEDDYVIITHRIDAKAMPWQFMFGFFRGGNDFEGNPVQMNLMDLGQL